MKIFPSVEIPKIDRLTIEQTPISPINLMEQAARECTKWLLAKCNKSRSYAIMVGIGNNGGDGLAIARQLAQSGRDVRVYICSNGKDLSELGRQNLDRLYSLTSVPISFVDEESEAIVFSSSQVVVDTLFGNGISRPIEGFYAQIIAQINNSGSTIVAIDMPSGLMGEYNSIESNSNIVRADFTLTFQFPKLSLLFPENAIYSGEVEVLNIGLNSNVLSSTDSDWELFTMKSAVDRLKIRKTFAHKGNFGHALLIAGAYGKVGAAVLASKATLRSGAGLLTTHVPFRGYEIIQNSFPEAMVSIDQSDLMFSQAPDLIPFSAVGIGPGIGVKINTQRGLLDLIKRCNKPMVIDADALNILAENTEWIDMLPQGSILTPHIGEFRRLVGVCPTGFERMQTAIQLATRFDGIVVVKGANTMTVSSNGKVFFNTTGNPGMATAGSGDVLTGIILGLLSSGYSSFDAARLGVYIHGMSGDLALKNSSFESIIASDILDKVGKSFHLLHKKVE